MRGLRPLWGRCPKSGETLISQVDYKKCGKKLLSEMDYKIVEKNQYLRWTTKKCGKNLLS
jgi:hypothetical protein